jgi:hypothetical protein
MTDDDRQEELEPHIVLWLRIDKDIGLRFRLSYHKDIYDMAEKSALTPLEQAALSALQGFYHQLEYIQELFTNPPNPEV